MSELAVTHFFNFKSTSFDFFCFGRKLKHLKLINVFYIPFENILLITGDQLKSIHLEITDNSNINRVSAITSQNCSNLKSLIINSYCKSGSLRNNIKIKTLERLTIKNISMTLHPLMLSKDTCLITKIAFAYASSF